MAATDIFSAWVSIDGVKLPQYGEETKFEASGAEVVSCWIASEIDKKFAVNYSIPDYPEILSSSVWVDGSDMEGFNHCRGARTQTLSYTHVSATSVRPLMFSKMELTDDEAHLGLNLKDLGEIKLEIWTAKEIKTTTYDGYEPSSMLTKIHERSKKAISHRVALGEEFTVEPTPFSDTQREKHLMSFIFKYRPREYLQAEGIMPPDPKPDRPEKRTADAIEPSDSEDDQEEELRRQEEELQNQLSLIREKRNKKKVKVEPVADLRVKSEIIDLT